MCQRIREAVVRLLDSLPDDINDVWDLEDDCGEG